MPLVLPGLHERVKWSIHVVDAETNAVLATHQAGTVCETASIGKVFLLIEVARRLLDGRLDAGQRIEIPAEHMVRDSGLLYRMHEQRIPVYDAAMLVGAVSDNLATNALISMCTLESVHGVAAELGYSHTALLDYIRNVRGPGLPWTPSYGSAAELCDLMLRLGRDEILSPEVSSLVRTWLAAGVDTSMVASGLLLDPLAHDDPEYLGMVLRHKTGSTDFARIDIGTVRGPAGSIAYAVAANWKDQEDDLREPVLHSMALIGEGIRTLAGGTR